ncbi:DNA cytosine methyltransferase [Cognatiluteimonas profundi]|uniref:DNA cytosine methyltransferase n=1 Tax=Cognatiluteimonas profundi TaxID=2594501 RepID=UPI0018EF0084|nr:DNA (cytosine-5-)-methyltransferase [Lysobacter profundi]
MNQTTNTASSYLAAEPRGGSSEPMQHIVAGLFAGIGGLERGLTRAGHVTRLLCENDAAASAVLEQRFDICPHGDVRTLARLPKETTLVVAGFPCQDLSQAGQTAGIEGSRSGLVGEVIRLIKAQRTPWVLLENVPFMLQLSSGRAMDVIATAFEQLGYRWVYRVIDSRAFGLPQRRRRVYFLASLVGDPRTVLFADEAGDQSERGDFRSVACGFYWTEGVRGLGWAVDAIPTLKGGSSLGIPSAPAVVLPDGTVGTPDLRDAERLQGFPSEWTKPAERVARTSARWKLVGNAVNVRAAEWIGKRLAKPGELGEFIVTPMNVGKSWPVAGWNMGDGRMQVAASEWPVVRKYQSLENFLLHPLTPLSAKATAGFLSRAERGGLRFPPQFLKTLQAHLTGMQNVTPRKARIA